MNNQLTFGLLAGCILVANGLQVQNNKKADKPNFVIILTDDQGYNDLGCFGSALIKTPNIDRLAQEGIRFTNFYFQPISGPARAALMTGCYPLRISEVGNVKRLHPKHNEDIPEMMCFCTSAGNRTRI